MRRSRRKKRRRTSQLSATRPAQTFCSSNIWTPTLSAIACRLPSYTPWRDEQPKGHWSIGRRRRWSMIVVALLLPPPSSPPSSSFLLLPHPATCSVLLPPPSSSSLLQKTHQKKSVFFLLLLCFHVGVGEHVGVLGKEADCTDMGECPSVCPGGTECYWAGCMSCDVFQSCFNSDGSPQDPAGIGECTKGMETSS